jgi:hypothetical protein
MHPLTIHQSATLCNFFKRLATPYSAFYSFLQIFRNLTHLNISPQLDSVIFPFQSKIHFAKILSHRIIHFMSETYKTRSPQTAILGLITLLLRRKAQ